MLSKIGSHAQAAVRVFARSHLKVIEARRLGLALSTAIKLPVTSDDIERLLDAMPERVVPHFGAAASAMLKNGVEAKVVYSLLTELLSHYSRSERVRMMDKTEGSKVHDLIRMRQADLFRHGRNG